MNGGRNWTVLFIGGASGTGKSTLVYGIGRFYGVNVLEADDIHQAVKAVTTRERFPAMHDKETGVNWKDIGVGGNVNWLVDVSQEMVPALKAVVDRHMEDNLPVIIEGDFIDPEFTVSFDNPEVKSIFVLESDVGQITRNFLSREGGEPQCYRAEISAAYGAWIMDACKRHGIPWMEARPWDTALSRAIKSLR